LHIGNTCDEVIVAEHQMAAICAMNAGSLLMRTMMFMFPEGVTCCTGPPFSPNPLLVKCNLKEPHNSLGDKDEDGKKIIRIPGMVVFSLAVNLSNKKHSRIEDEDMD
jgi:hypothetical protein